MMRDRYELCTEDLGDLTHRLFAVVKQRNNPQPQRIAQRLETIRALLRLEYTLSFATLSRPHESRRHRIPSVRILQ